MKTTLSNHLFTIVCLAAVPLTLGVFLARGTPAVPSDVAEAEELASTPVRRLASLPGLDEDARIELARSLAGARTWDGEPLLDADWLDEVIAGARLHPEMEAVWVLLLEAIVRTPLDERDLDQLEQVLALPELGPALLGVALAQLLPGRAVQVLPWADELAQADPRLAKVVDRAAGRDVRAPRLDAPRLEERIHFLPSPIPWGGRNLNGHLRGHSPLGAPDW